MRQCYRGRFAIFFCVIVSEFCFNVVWGLLATSGGLYFDNVAIGFQGSGILAMVRAIAGGGFFGERGGPCWFFGLVFGIVVGGAGLRFGLLCVCCVSFHSQ